MLERTVCKKDSKTSYDPQVGAAAQANAAIAERQVQFSEDFYRTWVAPMLEEMTVASKEARGQQADLYDLNMAQTRLQDQRYREKGIPAEDRYYKAVDDYSSAEEQEKQARGAIGDVRTAQAGQQASMMRQLQSVGVDPTSPAAIAAVNDQAIAGAAIEAGAATRARETAKSMGLALTADAANFGRGGQSGALQFGAAASGNSQAGYGIAQSAYTATPSGAGVIQQGGALGLQGYTANMNTYAGLQKAEMDRKAQSDAGFGKLLGTVASTAMTAYGGSDRRMKKNIRQVGRHRIGVPLYTFDYVWEPDGAGHVGVMADELVKVLPSAVAYTDKGYAMVDYSQLGGF